MASPDGGYAIKHLAAEYSVEYGDVLLWADWLRLKRIGLPIPYARGQLAMAAAERIFGALSLHRYLKVQHSLVALANARWGEPAPISMGAQG